MNRSATANNASEDKVAGVSSSLILFIIEIGLLKFLMSISLLVLFLVGGPDYWRYLFILAILFVVCLRLGARALLARFALGKLFSHVVSFFLLCVICSILGKITRIWSEDLHQAFVTVPFWGLLASFLSIGIGSAAAESTSYESNFSEGSSPYSGNDGPIEPANNFHPAFNSSHPAFNSDHPATQTQDPNTNPILRESDKSPFFDD